MQRWLGVLCCVALFLFISVKAFHGTEESEAVGQHVVERALERLKVTGLETNDTLLNFMRRLAWVESKFGSDQYTFRQGFHGGIWQEGLGAFRLTQNALILREKHRQIYDLLGIDWVKTPWRELRKPWYSALTKWLYLSIGPTPIPVTILGLGGD